MMDSGESPLQVLSRAATMVQDGLPLGSLEATKAPSSKQLPTSKWKRDRRSRLPEYSRKTESTKTAEKELLETAQTHETNKSNLTTDTPLDMSVRQRGLPPSYSQAINSSSFKSNRPTVITLTSSKFPTFNSNDSKGPGISMCDPIIDEHFRRSLGKDYAALFSNNNENIPIKKSIPIKVSTESPRPAITLSNLREIMGNDTASLSVDDHFAKALGETWFKLNDKNNETSSSSSGSESSAKDNTQIRVLST